MKVGIVVDGDAESQALKLLTRKIKFDGLNIIDPVYANMQPKSTPAQIARSSLSTIKILLNKGAELVVVLIDREDRTECPGELAKIIEQSLLKVGQVKVKVVIKNVKFENWLVADLDAIKALRNRFNVTEKFINLIKPNKADNIQNAENTINEICIGKQRYHKRDDPVKIMTKAKPENIAMNSRSFRRFLRVLNHPIYADQSYQMASNKSKQMNARDKRSNRRSK